MQKPALRIWILRNVAKALGLRFKIDGIPYGSRKPQWYELEERCSFGASGTGVLGANEG